VHVGLPCPGYGVFDTATAERRLTRPGARSPLEWSLPADFLPQGRPPLTYHDDLERWSQADGVARLHAVSRGQEFVLDLDCYPGVRDWALASIVERSRQ
jgi:hypothetical protein